MTASSTAPTLGRLTDSHDIATVFRGGRRRAGRLVVLHGRVRETDPHDRSVTDAPRFTVVASRKVGGAVSRNRAKRLLREAARRVDWRDGTDIVLVARNACASSTMPAVLDELRELADVLAITRDAA